LLDQVRDAIRLKHYAYRTEETYVQWIRRYILFHNKRHPKEMGKAEIEAFLTHLAVEGQVSASTQNQALSALLFLYREVLNLDMAGIDAVRAKRPQYVPTVLTKQEAIAVLQQCDGIYQLVVKTEIVVERLGGQTYLYVKIAGGDTLVVQTDGDNSSQLRDLVPIDISGDLCHLFNLQGEAVPKTRRHHLTVNK
jgi:integrase